MKGTAVTDERRGGSMTVEACIFLPVSLLLLIIMAGSFQFLRLEESLLFSGFYRLQAACVRFATEPEIASVETLVLGHQIRSSAEAELGEEVFQRCRVESGMDAGWSELLYGESDEYRVSPEDNIVCRLNCSWTVRRGANGSRFYDQLRFCGRKYSGEDQECVWIFPNWGERYHRKDCPVVGGERRRSVKDMAVQQGYTPCMICMEGVEQQSGPGLGKR